MIYLVNAFSINMLGKLNFGTVEFQKISREKAKSHLEGYGFVPAIGHPDLAAVVKSDLDIDGNCFNRTTVNLQPGDQLVVAQYRGPRLPEGTTELPKDATIEYWMAFVRP